MIGLPGYSISTQIYTSSRTLVCRGQRQSDQKSVIIKVMRSEYPSFTQLVQFRNQYTISKNLNFPGVVQPYSLEDYDNSFALIMEDFEGISLKDYTDNHPLSLSEFFIIAIQITTILEELHKRRVIHKDIKPANLLINPTTKEVKITDFSIASLLPKESQALLSPNVLEGTLAYLSPEQTGRMNRGIDYRSDFYSLGVTFYELLTGQLPFHTTDPMELVHCHIAKQPPSIHSLNADIPQVLSEIVEKLMAKMAEDRYQSALGLKYDLEICLQQWENTGQIASFVLRERDISDRFIIPEKLYGREKEVQTLLAAFLRVSDPTSQQKGRSEIMLVAGYSGVGKTAIVNEVHKPIVRQRGYFIKGKFDQFQRNIPFSALLQAFRDLIGQLLSESHPEVERWKAKILEAVRENGQVIIDVIPEVELLIGKQPPVAELEASASQNRFNLVFQNFIKAFTNAEHPLVIFLDDLQWADSASLNLIELLLCQIDTRYLLVIGAYRDNEVFPAHPLMLTIEEIRKNKATINTITLAPLNEADLKHLIADTLSCPPQVASPLSQLVYAKTKGNPFFSNQFLKVLYEDNLINFNFEARYWQCDIAKVRSLSLTDDVVEFMALQLQKLPENTQSALKLAACIGNSFDLNTLGIVGEKSLAETAADLWRVLQEGLIIPTSEVYKFFQGTQSPQVALERELSVTYKFLHDRVQQAAYSLIPEQQKQSTHLKIGQLLFANTTDKEREEKIFALVRHFNLGISLISDRTQKLQLAELNLIAGRKAKASTAYTAAFEYLTVGLSLLGADSWIHSYNLTLALHEEASQAAYLNGNFERMEQLILVVLQNARTLLDKIKVYEVKIQACVAQNQLIDAVNTALEALQLLGVTFPETVTKAEVELEQQQIEQNLTGKEIEALINLPAMADLNKLAAMRILSKVAPAAYFSNPALFQLIVFKQVNLSIEFGNAELSAYAYALYGLTLCGVNEDFDLGYRFGELAVSLLQKLHVKEIKPRILHTVNTTVRHWKIHLRETLQPLLEAYTTGRETGDFEYAGYASFIYSSYSYLSGKELTEVDEEITTINEALSQIKQETALNHNKIFRQAVLNLLGNSENPWSLIGAAYDEQTMQEIHQRSGDLNALHYLYCHKLILAYLFGFWADAVENATLAAQYLSGVPGMFIVAVFYLYDSLAQLAIYSDATLVSQKQSILDRIAGNQEKMQKWARYAPMNHLHKFYLVEAERHRVLGEKLEALEMYDRAISGAKENKYIQEEALANELAAKFYMEWGKEKIARTYMMEAYYCYTRWGAKAKIEDLEKRYPQLLAPILVREKISFDIRHTLSSYTINKTLSSTTNNLTEALDLSSVTKASQVLVGEIHLDKLLSKLMQVVMENGGAEKSCLILPRSGDWTIEAIAVCGSVNGEMQTELLQKSIPIYCTHDIPTSIINYVQRTRETILIEDATNANRFAGDSYIIKYQPKSILCLPLLNQGKLIAILYLENNLATEAFTSDRLEVLKVLCSHAAISLENARLYQESQNYAKQLEEYLEKLQHAQLQIIQTEKMAALGQLMSGIAHEINNPLSFIAGNIDHALEYTRDLIDRLALYEQHYPNPVKEIEENAADIELDFLLEDLPQLLESMKQGTDRIRSISNSMRIFSRSDTLRKVRFNIHEGIDSTLLILRHRLKANDARPEIQIIKNYGQLPEINCYSGQLNQVFMNILANAIEALEDSNQGKSYGEIESYPNQITINTEMSKDNTNAIIRIADNGQGMPEEVKQRIFEHLFTTKPVGKGTGLGLSIARQIVEKTHGGKLGCISLAGKGAEFVISIPID